MLPYLLLVLRFACLVGTCPHKQPHPGPQPREAENQQAQQVHGLGREAAAAGAAQQRTHAPGGADMAVWDAQLQLSFGTGMGGGGRAGRPGLIHVDGGGKNTGVNVKAGSLAGVGHAGLGDPACQQAAGGSSMQLPKVPAVPYPELLPDQKAAGGPKPTWGGSSSSRCCLATMPEWVAAAAEAAVNRPSNSLLPLLLEPPKVCLCAWACVRANP